MLRPVSSRMGESLWAGEPAKQVNSAWPSLRGKTQCILVTVTASNRKENDRVLHCSRSCDQDYWHTDPAG